MQKTIEKWVNERIRITQETFSIYLTYFFVFKKKDK